MKPQTVHTILIVGGLALIGFAIYTFKAQPTGSYKDRTEGKNNIVRPGGAMPPGKKVYQIWDGAYTSVDPLTRGL